MQEETRSVFSKYQHVDSLAKVQDIFLEPEVICTEKIHGTNARIGVIDGKIRIGGRNIDHTNDGDNAIMGFVGWVRNSGLKEVLLDIFKNTNIIFYGEWFGRGIQKGIDYGDRKDFCVFDIKIGGEYQDWDEVQRLANIVRFRTVPVLYRGLPKIEEFDKLLDLQSHIGIENGVTDEKNLHEGIVIKPSKMKRISGQREWLIAKYKPARWSERKSEKTNKSFKPFKKEVFSFVDEFVTSTRLEHVLDHLRDSDIDILDQRSIPNIIKEMNLDILREGKDEISELTKDETVEWKQISKLVSKQTVMLYKKYLHDEMVRKQTK